MQEKTDEIIILKPPHVHPGKTLRYTGKALFYFCLLLFILPVLTPERTVCQQDTSKISTDSLTVYPDSAAVPVESTPPPRVKESYKPFKPAKSSLLAVGLSAAIPGAGQAYDEAYWKIPIIWGLGGYWIYEWGSLNKSYKDYREKYLNSITTTNPLGNGDFRDQRDFYRDERDKFAWYLGLLYFLNVVDAYVGANLYDFEVTPDLGPNQFRSYQVKGTVHFRF